MPINNPNGNEVSEIVLPNGNTASKVIGPDGSTVFGGIPDSGVSRWEFEQDVADSWDANDGDDNTSAGYSTDAQTGTYAKAFDGTDDYVEVPHNSNQNPTNGTIGGWFKADNLGTNRRTMFQKTEVANSYILEVNTNSEVRFFVGGADLTSTATLSTNTYYHLVGTWSDGGTQTIYIDGSEDTSQSVDSLSLDNQNPLGIGAAEGADYFMDGLLDDLRIYNKELTSTEVNDWYSTDSI